MKVVLLFFVVKHRRLRCDDLLRELQALHLLSLAHPDVSVFHFKHADQTIGSNREEVLVVMGKS